MSRTYGYYQRVYYANNGTSTSNTTYDYYRTPQTLYGIDWGTPIKKYLCDSCKSTCKHKLEECGFYERK